MFSTFYEFVRKVEYFENLLNEEGLEVFLFKKIAFFDKDFK
jgi:hypothetical protein